MPIVNSEFRSALNDDNVEYIEQHKDEILNLSTAHLNDFVSTIIDHKRYYFLLHLHEMGIDLNALKDRNGNGLLDQTAEKVTSWNPMLQTALALYSLGVTWSHCEEITTLEMVQYENQFSRLAQNRGKIDIFLQSYNRNKLEQTKTLLCELYLYSCSKGYIKCINSILNASYTLQVTVKSRPLTTAQIEAARVAANLHDAILPFTGHTTHSIQRGMGGANYIDDSNRAISSDSSFSASLQNNVVRGMRREMMAPLPEDQKRAVMNNVSVQPALAPNVARENLVNMEDIDDQENASDEESNQATAIIPPIPTQNTMQAPPSALARANEQKHAEPKEIKKVPIIDMHITDEAGISGLHIATAHGQVDLLNNLIARGLKHSYTNEGEGVREYALRSVGNKPSSQVLSAIKLIEIAFSLHAVEQKKEEELSVQANQTLFNHTPVEKAAVALTGPLASGNKDKFCEQLHNLPDDAYRNAVLDIALAKIESSKNKDAIARNLAKFKMLCLSYKAANSSFVASDKVNSILTNGKITLKK